MNTFYTHIQPNIIRFSDELEIPENLRCKYAINYNVWGIDYFFENYLLQESTDGIYMILNENRFSFLLEDSLNDQEVLDIPRLYIIISDKFLEDTTKFQEFITKAAKDNEIYYQGIEGFRPGVDYFLNVTLFNYLANINDIGMVEETNPTQNKLPNYIDEHGNITKYFVDLSSEPIKDYTNLVYFNRKNKLIETTYSENELNNFYQSLCNIIKTYSTIESNSDIFNKPKNQIYDKVLNYFANSQIDDASISLNLLLNSSYNKITTNGIDCGCNGISGQGNSIITESCSSLYSQAMLLYFKQMFGDKEFYEDWFNIYLSDTELIPNDILIENLQLFIREFISIDYNLDKNPSTIYNCDCLDNISLNNSSLEYKKLNNFLQILDWINNGQTNSNVNKIKIYGEAFGELLPKLQF